MSDPCPLQETEATCHQLAGVVFPWDLTRSLELALLKTFCVPSISALLDRPVSSPSGRASATTTPV
jgi:hypothetical protein